MKRLPLLMALCVLASASLAWAAFAPVSDGTIYQERFTGNTPDDAKTNVINVGASIADEAGQMVTTTPTEGVVRAGTGLGIAPGMAYVLEYDFTVNAASGDNFYALYTQDAVSPWASDINMRVISDGSGDWEFQVDHGGDPPWAVTNMDFGFGQAVHFAVHRKPGPSTDVDVWVDGALFGTFPDRSPTLGVDLFQWGDGSGGAGFGDATVDNIIIGGLVPEPTALAALAVGVVVVLARRRT